jgi:cell division septation protein DedD
MSDTHRRRLRIWILPILAAAMLAVGFGVVGESAEAVSYSGPITITRGGVYSGNWESLSASQAAVTVATSEPVVIENSNIRSRGDLVLGTAAVNLEVRNSTGIGLNSMQRGREAGRFVTTDLGFTNLVVENNYLESTSGIWVYGYRGNYTPSNSVRIVANKAKNMDGRHSDGAGGYLTGEGDRTFVQFLQLDKIRNVPGMEVAWNEVINDPWNSRVEDNINLYASGGAAGSPMLIHDNFIWGAYPADPARWGFSGGGIIMGDAATGATRAGYVDVYDNQVVGTTNYGISVVCGNDQRVQNNRIVAANVLPDGSQIAGQNVGLSMGSSALWGSPCDNYVNNQATGNQLGWQRSGGRNDQWTPSCNVCANNTSLPGPITLDTERAEHQRWLQKVTSSGRTIGLVAPSQPAPTTTASPTTSATAAPTTSTTAAPTTTTTTTAPPTTTTTAPPKNPTRTTPSAGAGSGQYTVTLSSLAPVSAQNGYGPYERNMSNGEGGAGDGGPIRVDGTTYASGLGVNSLSRLTYELGGRWSRFAAVVGIDDHIADGGSVGFEVWVDADLVYSSGTVTASSPAKKVSVDVTGARQLTLVVTDGGDNSDADHADWADARLIR